ncbi:hypothetical protein B0T20DRAFT_85417 [Sordaria brevicollis]|uniref:Uncharacterized protein n=1 Tax=Sordaria brevicollis TaxID=83679 RepID=A0AAE0NW27_SORBR|nr:hypothetical protein B0T20DRAFT_85417 [Sordaria brevicollis]
MNFAPDFSTKSGKCGPGLNSPRLTYPKRKAGWQSQAPTKSGICQAFDSWRYASRLSPNFQFPSDFSAISLPRHARQGACSCSQRRHLPLKVQLLFHALRSPAGFVALVNSRLQQCLMSLRRDGWASQSLFVHQHPIPKSQVPSPFVKHTPPVIPATHSRHSLLCARPDLPSSTTPNFPTRHSLPTYTQQLPTCNASPSTTPY